MIDRRNLIARSLTIFAIHKVAFGGQVVRKDPQPVSLVRLIGDPMALSGRMVTVVGFFAPTKGIDRALGLYLSEIDAKNWVFMNSVDLSFSKVPNLSPILGKYVVLDGLYHGYASLPNNPGQCPTGYIDNISNIRRWDNGDALR
jgi:hypothetical protein